MRIILGELSYTEQPVEYPRLLVSVHHAVLVETERKLTVALLCLLEDLDMADTVHRFDAVLLLIDLREVHVFAVAGIVPRCSPHIRLEDLRPAYRLISSYAVCFVKDLFELRTEFCPFGHPERQSRSCRLVEHKELHLRTDLSVVALLRLFKHIQVCFERLLVREGDPVDTCQHLRLLVPAEVGTCHTGELEVVQEP